ncbi:MAG: serine/threonine protein kinase [Planctomycetes bacterium]|nr:serine/threonine protein kinase [Planctomycetota bacterium]
MSFSAASLRSTEGCVESPSLAQPRLLGGWRLIRRLSTTHWFHVDLATPATCDPDWPADYVVKSVRADRTEAHAAQWLRREFEVTQQVAHPHLATVLCGQFDDPPAYVVQPWYEGLPVRRLKDDGRLGIAPSLWIVRQTAEALSALHQNDWMHGDVKPDNVIVSSIGHATLLDLGFAQRLTRRSSGVPAGVLQTTVAYAAPELFQETAESTRSADIYSLGVMLFELLGGRPPFVGRSRASIAQRHLHEIPADVRTLNPKVPSRVARLVMQLLLKDPARRPDASEVAEQLVRLEIDSFELV